MPPKTRREKKAAVKAAEGMHPEEIVESVLVGVHPLTRGLDQIQQLQHGNPFQQTAPVVPQTMADVIKQAVAHYRSTVAPADSNQMTVKGPPVPRIGDSSWSRMSGPPPQPPPPMYGVPATTAALDPRYGQKYAASGYQYAALGTAGFSANAPDSTSRFGRLLGDVDDMEIFKHEDDLSVAELSKKIDEYRESRRALDKRIKELEMKRAALVEKQKKEAESTNEQ